MTQDEVKQLFDYKDGNLYWHKRPNNQKKIGDKVGHARQDGYISTTVNGKSQLVHRIVFLMHYGYLPKLIDHIDGNPSNNHIENLRDATQAQNMQNSKFRKNNTSGCKGVSWYKRGQQWRVQTQIGKKTTHIGYFDDLELAELVAIEARDKYYGKFAKHG